MMAGDTFSEIVLIGPMRVGKSTIARLLAERLGIPQASLDAQGWKYYTAAGFNMDRARRLREVEGELSSYRYLERFLLPALVRHLHASRGSVIDVGAGHTVYWDEATLARARAVLAPYRNVVLLLPSPDLDESAAVLRARTRGIAWLERIREQNGFDLNERFLRHRSNFDLARHIVYTQNKSPQETRDEILHLLALAGPAATR